MRKELFIVVMVIVVVAGCATKQEVDKDGRYGSTHVGIGSGPDNAVSAAIAYRIRANADYTRTKTEAIKNGEVIAISEVKATTGKFNVLILNSSQYPYLMVGLSAYSPDGEALKDIIKGDMGTEFIVNEKKFIIYVYRPDGTMERTINHCIQNDSSVPYVDGRRYSAIINLKLKKK